MAAGVGASDVAMKAVTSRRPDPLQLLEDRNETSVKCAACHHALDARLSRRFKPFDFNVRSKGDQPDRLFALARTRSPKPPHKVQPHRRLEIHDQTPHR